MKINIKNIMPHLLNVAFLMLLTFIYIISYEKSREELRTFTMAIIIYVWVANVVSIYLRFYGVMYVKHKPRLLISDGKTYFRTNISEKLTYNTYYGYPCWGFTLGKTNESVFNRDGELVSYYRTKDDSFSAITQTKNIYKVYFVNIITVLIFWFTIFVIKE